MYCRQWTPTYVFHFLLLVPTLTWSSPHMQASCQSCHIELTHVLAHPFPTQLPIAHRRNPRCMRCHNPFLFKALSSGTVKTLRLQKRNTPALIDKSCTLCHSSVKEKENLGSKEKNKSSLVESSGKKLTWLARCQTCHSPPFSRRAPSSLQKALHQLKQTHTISSPMSKSNKTRLDTSSTFQVHQSPHSPIYP